MQNLSPDPGGVLFSAIYKNRDAQLSFWREPDIGRSVVQPAVLVDDQEGSGSDVLPGEALLEVWFTGDKGLFAERIGFLNRPWFVGLFIVATRNVAMARRGELICPGAGHLN